MVCKEVYHKYKAKWENTSLSLHSQKRCNVYEIFVQ